MRRRRQKNPLLMRIIIASVVVHIIALPILAHFGALKKIQSHFVETKMVVLAPPPPVKQDPPKTVQRKAVSAPVKSRRGSGASRGSANHLHVAVQRSNNASGSGDGGTSIEQGTKPPGTIETGGGGTKPGPKSETPTPLPVTPKEPVKPMPAPVIAKEPIKPMPKPVEPTPQPMPQPHVPVFTEATAIDGKQVQPEIPDALRGDPLDATAVVEVTVGPDGVPTDAAVSQSAGKKELDKLALDAAKQWRFKPAMRDGEAIASKVRLHFEFQVN